MSDGRAAPSKALRVPELGDQLIVHRLVEQRGPVGVANNPALMNPLADVSRIDAKPLYLCQIPLRSSAWRGDAALREVLSDGVGRLPAEHSPGGLAYDRGLVLVDDLRHQCSGGRVIVASVAEEQLAVRSPPFGV